MRARWLLLLLLVAGSIPFAPATLAAQQGASLAIVDVTVIDTVRGERIGLRTVLVIDGRIAQIGPPATVRIPPGVRRIEGHGLYLTPGLVDLHVHLFNNASRRPPNDWAFPLFLANGVTAVREMNTEPAQIATVRRWRAAVETGALAAPRILAAGVAVNGKSVEDAPSPGASSAHGRRGFYQSLLQRARETLASHHR